jgi:hypothetical protein
MFSPTSTSRFTRLKVLVVGTRHILFLWSQASNGSNSGVNSTQLYSFILSITQLAIASRYPSSDSTQLAAIQMLLCELCGQLWPTQGIVGVNAEFRCKTNSGIRSSQLNLQCLSKQGGSWDRPIDGRSPPLKERVFKINSLKTV